MSFRIRKKECQRLDYGFDWDDETVFPEGDDIDTSEWDADLGIVIDEESQTARSTTVFVSGGTKGQKYTVKNTVTTDGGRIDCNKIIFTIV